jgi:(hydroxyamino)benzene mutase
MGSFGRTQLKSAINIAAHAARGKWERQSRHLLFHGTLLFLPGLLNGVVIPYLHNPRMGLSAHLAGVQNGLVLMAFGLMWPHAGPPRPSVAYWTSLYGMYGIWVALLLAAVWGTSRSTPIAGAGFTAAAWQERTVTALITSGSAAVVVATVLLLYGGLFNKLKSE